MGMSWSRAIPTIRAVKEPTVPGAFGAKPEPPKVIKSLFKVIEYISYLYMIFGNGEYTPE